MEHEMHPKIYHPRIYLRNKFSIRQGFTQKFFEGQDQLLKQTRRAFERTDTPDDNEKSIRLVAGCRTQPLIASKAAPESLPEMMHIWTLPQWDTLYQLMYLFSESDWYAQEVSSLEIEHQDLLVGIGAGFPLELRPPAWLNAEEPNYVYLYDEFRLWPLASKLRFLRLFHRFLDHAKANHQWSLVWLASEITGTPGQICALWRLPNPAQVDATFKDPIAARCHADMTADAADFKRKFLYPESTEHIDNGIESRA